MDVMSETSPQTEDERPRISLRPMLEARSVAVVGASSRPDSFGEQLILQLRAGRFDGDIYPVNPRYDEILGLRCYPTMADLPARVDLAILGVSNALIEEQLLAAVAAGAGSAAIFCSCHEPPGPGASLAERLARTAREAGVAICGGNGMGFVNVDRGLRACGFPEPEGLEPGPITFISHSGSVFSAMLHNDRGLRFNLVVSSGLELTTTVADYLEYALSQPTTGVVGLFIETARDPEAFRAALARAAERDVPVVCLKVGREARAQELIVSHSGAMAGEDAAFDALFDAYGVLRVNTLDEMADTLELFASGRRAGQGGLSAVLDSGGERAHLIDVASSVAVSFADISEGTRRRLEGTLEEGLPAVNPLDAWGTGNEDDRIFTDCMRALLDDPTTAALAFAVDMTTQVPRDAGYVAMAKEVFVATAKPMAVLSHLAAGIDRADAASLRSAGIPVLEGTETGLRAFGHLFRHRDALARPPVSESEPVTVEVRERWRKRLTRGPEPGLAEALRLLADYGIAVAGTETASDLDDALEAAASVGWPVAIKTASPDVSHKTDVGGVRLEVGGPVELEEAYREMSERLGPDVVIQSMGPAGIELALGVVNDRQFGPLVMVAAGGVLIEVIRDRRFAFPPLDGPRARALIDGLAIRPLLGGARGQAAADLEAVTQAVVRLSVLAMDLGDLVGSLDVNPLIAAPEGYVALDALIDPNLPTG
jgi:acetate---CoA ligase (ADP-forming)